MTSSTTIIPDRYCKSRIYNRLTARLQQVRMASMRHLLLMVAAALALGMDCPLPAAEPAKTPGVRPYGIDKRTLWTTSHVAGFPEPPPSYQAVPTFDKLKF